MKIVMPENFNGEENKILDTYTTDQPCGVNDLTDEETAIWRFMDHSERINGKIIVPPWMKEKADAILIKLGITND